jgi:Ser/Thr protein kinase RdoA (MazF antagonist)
MIDSQPWETQQAQEQFPVVYSILAPQALVSLILPHYHLGKASSCQFWHRGLSDIYLLNIQERPYILRVSHHHWRSRSEIAFELELLDFLAQNDIPVAYPLKTKEGNLFIEINAPEGIRHVSLFVYAPGTVALGDLNATQSYLLGETVAKLHQVAREFCSAFYRPPLTLDYLLDDSLALIAPFLEGRPQDLSLLLQIATQIKQRLKDLPKEPPYWGICWGDPHSGNVHFTLDHQITLFDFDQCGYGWRMFDIAKFWQVSLQTGLSKSIREAFLAGYQAHETITDLELASLQTLTQTAYIWAWAISLSATRLYDYSRLDKSYFNQRLERLKCLNSQDWQLF